MAESTTEAGGWDQYADLLTVSYLGQTEGGEPVVFCANDDITFAILGIADPETLESMSCVGEVTEEADGSLTITDTTSNYSLTFAVVDNGDGTLTLDMGDLGACTIAACEQAEAFDALNTLDTYTTAVA